MVMEWSRKPNEDLSASTASSVYKSAATLLSALSARRTPFPAIHQYSPYHIGNFIIRRGEVGVHNTSSTKIIQRGKAVRHGNLLLRKLCQTDWRESERKVFPFTVQEDEVVVLISGKNDGRLLYLMP